MLSILDAESATIHIEGLDKLGDMANSHGFGFVEALVPLAAVILIFGTPIIIVIAVLRYRSNRQRLVNEMVLKLADKGQPIPPELFMEPIKPKSQESDLRRGIVLISVGIGLMGFFKMVGGEEGMGIGFIPMMIGVGYLVAWKLEQGKKSN